MQFSLNQMFCFYCNREQDHRHPGTWSKGALVAVFHQTELKMEDFRVKSDQNQDLITKTTENPLLS